MGVDEMRNSAKNSKPTFLLHRLMIVRNLVLLMLCRYALQVYKPPLAFIVHTEWFSVLDLCRNGHTPQILIHSEFVIGWLAGYALCVSLSCVARTYFVQDLWICF